jgi:TolA-binding protein
VENDRVTAAHSEGTSTTIENDPSARAQALLQEADAFRTRQRAIRVQIYALDEVMRDADLEKRPDLQQRRQSLESELAAWQARAVSLLERMVDDPELAQAPERADGLLQLASTLREGGETAAATSRYQDFVDRYPRSSRAPEAYLALAEVAFSDERLEEAVRYCNKIIELPTSDRRAAALYLKSWSLRGLDEGAHPEALREALDALREIVRQTPRSPRGADAKLQKSAEQELVELYARHGDPEGAKAFFERLGQPRGARLLADVKTRYDRSKPPKAGP